MTDTPHDDHSHDDRGQDRPRRDDPDDPDDLGDRHRRVPGDRGWDPSAEDLRAWAAPAGDWAVATGERSAADGGRAARWPVHSRQDGPGSAGGRPLVVTADDALLDDLLRLASISSASPDVAADAGAAVRRWLAAPLVLVGVDLADQVAAASPVRRAGVLLVGRDLDDATVWRRAVAIGAEHVVLLPDGEPWLVDRLADAAEGGGGEARTVAVVGGRGGAGATVLATALAVASVRRGSRTMLVDGDPLGGGIDLVVGGEDQAGLRWPDLVSTRGRVGAESLRSALPQVDDLRVLSWDRSDSLTIPGATMREVLAAGRRGSDLVVVDLPRRVDAAVEETLTRATTTLLVVPAEIRATAAAARVAAALTLACADVRLVVRGPAPSGLDGAVIAASLGLPLAGELAPEPRLAESLERGEPPGRRARGPLGRFCDRFLDDLGIRQRAA